MSSVLILFLVASAALVVADESLMSPGADSHHHVTTVCIQVHGNPMCGPVVKSDAAQMEAARASQFQEAPAMVRDAMSGAPPGDAVLQGYYDSVPVYRMRSAGEKNMQQQTQLVKSQQQQPCPEPASRSAGSITVVQPPNPYNMHGGLGGVGIINPLNPLNPLNSMGGSTVLVQQQPQGLYRSADPAPAARTIPFAPFGVNPQQQQQQMRASQFARSQHYAAMRAAAEAADCDKQQQQQHLKSSNFQAQQQMRASNFMAQPQSYDSLRESQPSAQLLAQQCAQQEMEIKKKSEEISELKKQISQLSSSVMEKTTTEQKTVSTKSSSDVQKQITEDAKSKDPQLIKKKK